MLIHHRVPSMNQLGVLLLFPGWDVSPSQGTQHEATRSITAPPDGMLVHHRVPSMKVSLSVANTYWNLLSIHIPAHKDGKHLTPQCFVLVLQRQKSEGYAWQLRKNNAMPRKFGSSFEQKRSPPPLGQSCHPQRVGVWINSTTSPLAVRTCIPGCSKTECSKISCLRKQHNGRDQAQTTDLLIESTTRETAGRPCLHGKAQIWSTRQMRSCLPVIALTGQIYSAFVQSQDALYLTRSVEKRGT